MTPREDIEAELAEKRARIADDRKAARNAKDPAVAAEYTRKADIETQAGKRLRAELNALGGDV